MNRPRRIILAAVALLIIPAMGIGPLAGPQEPGPPAAEPPALVGDGRADDTEALQRAVDEATGPVRLPRGTYRITRPITIELDEVGFTSLVGDGVATVVMDGPGPAIRLVGTHFRSAAPSGFEPRIWDRQRMPTVDGLAIRGTHPEADGIEAVGTMQLTITRAHIRGCRHAIRLAENNRNVIISDSHLYENRGIGLFLDEVDLHQINVTGCHISYNDGGGIVSLGGNVRNLHVTGCDVESNMGADSPPTANILIDARGSRYGTAEVAITGCTIQHNSTGPDSTNIRIIGRSEQVDGEPGREGNVTISGNVLSDVQVNIHLQHCRGVTLTGNTFWMGYRHNLLVEHCASVVLAANNMDRNPRYAYGRAAEARNAVVFRDSEDCTITGLHVTNVKGEEAGVLLDDCRRMNVVGCTILDCDGAGLLARDLRHSRISDCLIRDDRSGASNLSLKLSGGEGNQVVDNALGGDAEIDPQSVGRGD